jgi:4-amino-4-deoxy-L-arabinose transferase-like glycosyltransferase
VKRKTFLLLAAILGLGACLRLPSLTFPIWLGDEATYVGYAQNLLSGRVNYINDFHYITPGITYVYSFLLFLFGANNMLAVHLATILVYGGNTYIIYRLGSHLADERAGLMAALLFSVYNVCFNPMWCFSSLPEPFYIFFNTLGIYVLLKHKKKSAFISGMILAVSVLFKQSELLIILTALIYLTVFFPHLLITFMAGTATVFSAAFLILVWQGAWGDFWYQNFEILLKYLSKRWETSLNHGMKAPTSQVIGRFAKSHVVVWGGAILTIAYISTQKLFNIRGTPRGNIGSGEKNVLLTSLKERYQGLVLIIIWPLLYGISFFLLSRIYPYYLLVLLPPLTVLAGVGFSLLWQDFRALGRVVAAILLTSAVILSYQREGFPVMSQTLHYIIRHFPSLTGFQLKITIPHW